MYLIFGHMIVPIYYQLVWQPSLHHLYQVGPMFFLHLHAQCSIMSLPLTYFQILVSIQHILLELKDLIFLVSRNHIGYVLRYVSPIPTPHIVGDQHIIVVQPFMNKDRRHVQQQVMALVTTTTPINIEMHQINDKLSTCVPRRIFVHHPLNGRQLGNSPR